MYNIMSDNIIVIIVQHMYSNIIIIVLYTYIAIAFLELHNSGTHTTDTSVCMVYAYCSAFTELMSVYCFDVPLILLRYLQMALKTVPDVQ